MSKLPKWRRVTMQYERHFASQKLELAREALKDANRKLDKVEEWLKVLSQSIEDASK